MRSPPGLRRKCDRPPASEESAIAPWFQTKVRSHLSGQSKFICRGEAFWQTIDRYCRKIYFQNASPWPPWEKRFDRPWFQNKVRSGSISWAPGEAFRA
ncbi:MAG: hypothetical protein AB4352_03610 [Hormoscilla sp.]